MNNHEMNNPVMSSKLKFTYGHILRQIGETPYLFHFVTKKGVLTVYDKYYGGDGFIYPSFATSMEEAKAIFGSEPFKYEGYHTLQAYFGTLFFDKRSEADLLAVLD